MTRSSAIAMFPWGPLATLLILGGGALASPCALLAQDASIGETVLTPTAPPPAEVFGQSAAESPEGVTPRGAFIRSLIIPGWGQVSAGAVGRGGFYFAAQAASYWMIRKSGLARSEASAFVGMEREIATARLQASGVEDPAELRQGVDRDPDVRKWENLEDLRGQQVEDWAALSIFLALIGAADAVVSTHLRDYPEPLALRVGPVGRGDRVQVGLSIPVGGIGR